MKSFVDQVTSVRWLNYEYFYSVIQFDALTEGFTVNFDVKKTLDELRSLTRPHKRPRPGANHPARLFGKDLLSTVGILKRTQSLFKREQGKKTLAKETLTSYTETASNILDLENQDTWLEIEEVRIIHSK